MDEGPNEQESETTVTLDGVRHQTPAQAGPTTEGRGEAPGGSRGGVTPTAGDGDERSGSGDASPGLMERVVERSGEGVLGRAPEQGRERGHAFERPECVDFCERCRAGRRDFCDRRGDGGVLALDEQTLRGVADDAVCVAEEGDDLAAPVDDIARVEVFTTRPDTLYGMSLDRKSTRLNSSHT